MKICMHVVVSVVNDIDKQNLYSENATSATVWFKPKMNISWKNYVKPYLLYLTLGYTTHTPGLPYM